jgi:hypothetical protein
MGDRWVSLPTFTTTRHPGKQLTVDARAVGLDDRGRQMDVYGSVSTTLTMKATYDQPNDLTQVSISQQSH